MMVTELRRWRKSLFLALFLIGMVPWVGCGSTEEAADDAEDTADDTEDAAQTTNTAGETTLTIMTTAVNEALDNNVAALTVNGGTSDDVSKDCTSGGTVTATDGSAVVNGIAPGITTGNNSGTFNLTITFAGPCDTPLGELTGTLSVAGNYTVTDADGDNINEYSVTDADVNGDVTFDGSDVDLDGTFNGTLEGVSASGTYNGTLSGSAATLTCTDADITDLDPSCTE